MKFLITKFNLVCKIGLLKILLLMVLFIVPGQLVAQLSGNRTIGSGGDFASFSEAVDTLNAQGVDGAVTFNVLSGTYMEQFEIGSITGASAANTIVFQSESGNTADVTVQFEQTSGANYIVSLNDADYVTFQNITFTALGTSYGRIFNLGDNSDNNSVLNCVLNGASTTSTNVNFAIVHCNPTSTTSDNITIENNIFNDGGTGVYFQGVNTSTLASGVQILNNVFNGVRRGVDLTYHNAPEVIGNTIVALSDRGIEFNYCDGPLQILKNEISVGNTYGIYVVNSDGGVPPGGTPGLIANNFIHVGGTSTAYGIFMNVSTYQNVYNNSVNITSPHATAGRALYVTGGGSNSINIENNIFANQSLGYAYYINTPGAVGTSDYNDIYSAGNFVAYWGADRIDLAALQGASGKETNSLSVYPHYSSSTDLHTVAPWLDGAGTSLTEVSDDVDGDARGGTPDIGADEFVPDPATTTPLAGSYTIGSGGDYASFAEAVNDVVLKGVSGPVSFDVLAGTYSEQVSLVSIAGSSAEDTVTFQSSGNAADVTLFYAASGANDNWVFRLYGADNVRIRNLTLTANNTSNPTYGRVIYMVGGVDSIGIRDNILNGSPTTSTNAANLGIVYATNSNYRSRIIAGNEFNGGSVGVSIAGINTTVLTSGTRVINNSFTNVRWGVDLTYQDAPEVIGNTIVALSDRGER